MRINHTLMTDVDLLDYLEMLVKSFRAKGHHDCAASLSYWINQYKLDQKRIKGDDFETKKGRG